VSLVLESSQAMLLVWGEQQTLLYNGGCAPLLGPRHPAAFGLPLGRAWPEGADALGAVLKGALGEAPCALGDVRLFLRPAGGGAEVVFEPSCSPLRDDEGAVAGALCVLRKVGAPGARDGREAREAQDTPDATARATTGMRGSGGQRAAPESPRQDPSRDGGVRVGAERPERGDAGCEWLQQVLDGLPMSVWVHDAAGEQEQTPVEAHAVGLGLGLPLSRGLVELHGGTLRARSEGAGTGAELEVRLPRAGAASGQAGAYPGTGCQTQTTLTLGSALDGTPEGPAGRGRAAQAREPAVTSSEAPPTPGGGAPSDAAPPPAEEDGGAPPPAVRILLVEDEEDVAISLQEILELDGHRVSVAPRGAEALALLRGQGADVVLCDIGLPDMDGYELARRVRDDPGGAEVCLVAVTGYSGPEERARSREAGFDAQLDKPVDLAALDAVLWSRGSHGSRGSRGR